MSEAQLEAKLCYARLTAQQAVEVLREHPIVRERQWLTFLLLQAVERNGYDRGRAAAEREAEALRAPEPRETVEADDDGRTVGPLAAGPREANDYDDDEPFYGAIDPRCEADG